MSLTFDDALAISGQSIDPDALERYLLAALVSGRGTDNKLVARGVFGYKAGTAAGNVDVPTDALVRQVTVQAGGTDATVTILGGDTITVKAGGAVDIHIDGEARATASTNEIVIGGGVTAYFVSWIV